MKRNAGTINPTLSPHKHALRVTLRILSRRAFCLNKVIHNFIQAWGWDRGVGMGTPEKYKQIHVSLTD